MNNNPTGAIKYIGGIQNKNVDVILAEGVPSNGLGMAIMNRLRKAAAYNVVEL